MVVTRALAALTVGGEHFVHFERHGFAYGRIPKAANSSIKLALQPFAEAPTSPAVAHPRQDSYWRSRADAGVKMCSARQLVGQGDVFVFTFVRHPVERLRSLYREKFVVNPEMARGYALYGMRAGMPFRAFVRRICMLPDWLSDVHFRSQSSMLCWRGELVPQFVGRVETIEADWSRLRSTLADRCGVKLRKVLTHRHRSTDPRAGDEVPDSDLDVDDELMATIRRRYADDFRLFYAEDAPS